MAEKSFEERLAALEETVKKMESGKLSLEETLAAYESGVKEADELKKQLDAAEKRMLELSGGELKPMENAP